MNEQQLRDHLQESAEASEETEALKESGAEFTTEDNSGLLTNDTGFVVRVDGKRFHVTVQEF